MNPAQRVAAHDLLKAGLSARGYLTAVVDHGSRERCSAPSKRRSARRRPRRRGRRREPLVRDPERYFFSVFGTPSSKDTWGWRVEGHHVSLQFTVVNGTLVAGSPTFFGANPAEVREGPQKGLRVLGPEEDAARALLAVARRVAARKGDHHRDGAERHVDDGEGRGVAAVARRGSAPASMNASQRDLLMKLIDVYVGYMPADIAADRRARFEKADVGKIAFAWAGETEKGQEALLPRPGPDVPRRVRQHPERRQPYPLGLARLQRRLRPRPAARASGVEPALTRRTLEQEIASVPERHLGA